MSKTKMRTSEIGDSAIEELVAPLKEPANIGFMSIEDEYVALFKSMDADNKGFITTSKLLGILKYMGIRPDDPRLQIHIPENGENAEHDGGRIGLDDFKRIIQLSQGDLVKNAIKGELVIPDFKTFTADITEIFKAVHENNAGHVATYIPQLGRVNPEQFAVSVCTIDGQRLSLGDANTRFCIQSISKPINYCIALEEHGETTVHQHVGREQSGIGFNGLVLNSKGLPHNPMINAGAIMCCSLVRPAMEMADRFDYVLDMWTKLSGGIPATFNNSVYLSERLTADRNFALGYFMREKKAFPENTDLLNTLEFYFQCCSIELNADAMAITAATLANAGVCPITGESILKPETVKNCLSLMSSCGMYDFSGEFAFTIGLPAKSGVAGGLMIVIPNLMGICVWSPRLDELGNSVRGIHFCKELVKKFNFHNFDSLTSRLSHKTDPRLRKNQSKISNVISMCWAASEGDLLEIQHLLARGINVNEADYDGRTPLHLAASEGHANVVAYLIAHNANVMSVDRWGNTPLDDAHRGKHEEAIKILERTIHKN
jgi:glutaminase